MINSLCTVPLLDYAIFNGTLNQIGFSGKTLINTINQYSFCIAEKDLAFKTALQGSDVLLPDGMAVVAAIPIALARLQSKNAFSNGGNVLLAGFGVGYSWGGCVLKY